MWVHVLWMGLMVLAGVLTWSFLEYGLHHWYGHIANGRNHFSREHLKHHRIPGYFSPTIQKIAAAIPVTLSAFGVAVLIVRPLYAAVFAMTMAGAYAGYEIIHFRAHRYPPKGAYGRWFRKNHFAHHFASAKHSHGVTSPIWDHVFGTCNTVDLVRVPREHVMCWLTDPETGGVRAEFATDYQLRT